MQVWDILSSMFFPDFPIFEPNGAWIGCVIKACLDPITAHDIISVFPNPAAE